jgi:hypothetical protein
MKLLLLPAIQHALKLAVLIFYGRIHVATVGNIFFMEMVVGDQPNAVSE